MYKKLAIIVGLMTTAATALADQHNLIVQSANAEVKVYCAPEEIGPDYKENLFLTVPAGSKNQQSLTDLFKDSTTGSVGCNLFYKDTLLGNFGFVLTKSGELSVGSAGLLVDTNYYPMVGKSAPDIYITTTYAPANTK